MIGTIINNRYRIDAELGKGGMGTVYQAHDTTLKRDVAVKLVSNTRLGTEGRTRLLHEAQTVANLKHPNIVTVYDAGEFDEQPYIVMEYIQGKTLNQHEIGDIENILDITQQICLALNHAHSQEIIHRDLKPENIIIEPGGTVRLMDFGLALSTSSRLTSEGGITGTVFYMSPEQAMGAKLGPQTDLYSLGVMLYEMVTGELPFNDPNAVAVITQHINAPVVPPRAKKDNIPTYLNNLIVNLLEKAPADRPQSAQAIIDFLENPQEQVAPEIEEELSVLDRIVRGHIIGRQEELDQAKVLWTKTLSHNGQLVLISGEPGIGKTRFTREIITQAEVSGGHTYIGECHPEGNTPYNAFADIIRRALRQHQDNDIEFPQPVLAELLELTPELKTNYPNVEPNPTLDPEAEQRRLFEHMITFCQVISENAPLLLVIEDVHWADSSTLAMMNQLARRTQELPVMIIGTYREVELDEALPFNQTIQDLNRQNLGSRISLKRLDKQKTHNLLKTIFAEEITEDFVEGIYKETEGNPFFIEEVCKALVESGQLVFKDGHWDRPSMEEMQIPQGVKVAIQSRLTKLSEDTQNILLFASVIGRVFDYPTLEKVSEKDEDTLIDSLEEAMRHQLIEEIRDAGGEEFNFSHALIPFTLRESVSGLRRSRLHRKVAAAIEETYPDDFERLAHHWGEAGDEDKGLGYTIQAAQRARQTYANQEALRLYSEALALLPQNHPQRYDMLSDRASVYQVVGQYDLQQIDAEAMLAIAEKENDTDKNMESLIALATVALRTDATQVIPYCEQVIELAEPLNAKGYLGQAYSLMGNQAQRVVEYPKAVEYYRKADPLLQEAGLMKQAAVNLNDMVIGLNQFDPAASIETAQRGIELSKKSGDKLQEATALRRLAIGYNSIYKFEEALESAQESLDMMRVLGDRNGELHALNILGIQNGHLNNFDQSEKDFLDAYQIGKEINDDSGQRYPISNLIELYTHSTGAYEKGYMLIDSLLENIRKQNLPLMVLMFAHFQRETMIPLGQYQKALESCLATQDLVEQHLDTGIQITNLCRIAKLNFELGDFEKGLPYFDQAIDLIKANTFHPSVEIYIWVAVFKAAILQPKLISLDEILIKIETLMQNFREIDDFSRLKSTYYPASSLHLALADQDPSHIEKALEYLAEGEKIKELGIPAPELSIETQLLLHVRVHRAAGQDEQANDYLKQAHAWVTSCAEKITNPDFRKSYLENVPDVVTIQEEYKKHIA